METSICIECLDAVGELEGWETTSGKVMCPECFDSTHGATAFWRVGPTDPVAALLREGPEFWLGGPAAGGAAPASPS